MGDWDFLHDMKSQGYSQDAIFDSMPCGYNLYEANCIEEQLKDNEFKSNNEIDEIVFLDFEFGQIYGSYFRDFLVTEVAILIYNTKTNKISLSEMLFFPDTDLVSIERVKTKSGRYRIQKSILNLYTNKSYSYNKNFKISKNDYKQIRKEWNKKYFNKLNSYLNKIIGHIPTIYLFGGNEDIKILNRYKIKIEDKNIIDIQTILKNNDKSQYSLEIQDKLKLNPNKRYSLDLLINRFNFNNIVINNRIEFSKFSYDLPIRKENFTYKKENLIAHHSSGDCLRLFCIYKELIEKFNY